MIYNEKKSRPFEKDFSQSQNVAQQNCQDIPIRMSHMTLRNPSIVEFQPPDLKKVFLNIRFCGSCKNPRF